MVKKSKMTAEQKKMYNWVCETYPEAMLMDGYNDCILGVCTRFGQDPIVAYSKDKVIKKLMAEGMSEEDAVEFFEFNQIGAWVGDTTPCFIETP